MKLEDKFILAQKKMKSMHKRVLQKFVENAL